MDFSTKSNHSRIAPPPQSFGSLNGQCILPGNRYILPIGKVSKHQHATSLLGLTISVRSFRGHSTALRPLLLPEISLEDVHRPEVAQALSEVPDQR